MRKFNTRIIPKEYSDDDDLCEIYANGEIKYLLKENIISKSGFDKLYNKHGIIYLTLFGHFNKFADFIFISII